MAQNFQTSTANIRPTNERQFMSQEEKDLLKSVKTGISLGSWNVATNSPALTASSANAATNSFYDVTVAGNAPFAGQNFAQGSAFAVGDQLWKVGSAWYRKPYSTVVAARSIGSEELKDAAISREKLTALLEAYFALLDQVYTKGYENSPYAYVKMDSAGNIGFFLDLAGRLGTPLVPDIGGTLAEIRDRTYAWPNESGYVSGKADAAGNIAYGLTGRGIFLIRGRDVLGEVDTINGRTAEWPDESGYVYSKTDAQGNILYGFNKAFELVLKGASIYDTFAPKSIAQLVQPSRNVVCAGDSLTEMGWPAIFANLLNDGRTVTNKGKGGDTSTQIAFRMGAVAVGLSVNNNQIPASGAVTVTPTNAEIMQKSYSATGTVFGVVGTLARAANGSYTFSRATAGTVVLTDRVSMFSVDAVGYDYQTTVIWAGRNNYDSPATVLSDIAAMVANLKSSGKRFVVLSVLNGNYAPYEALGGAGYDKIVNQINGVLRTTYPRNYLDVRELLIRNYNSAISQDVTDVNNDIVPASLRVDQVHLNDAGKALIAQKVKDFFIQNNY